MGVRIFKLAKEIGKTSKELIEYLRTQGHSVSSHMATIEDPVANILRDRLKPKETAKPAKAGETARPAKGAPKRASDKTATDAGERAPSSSPERGREPARTGSGTGSADERDKAKTRKDNKQRKPVRIFVQDDVEDSPSFFSTSRKRPPPRRMRRGGRDGGSVAVKRPEQIEVTPPIAVKELSALTTLRVGDILRTLLNQGQMATINASLNEEQVTLVCLENSIEVTFKANEEDLDVMIAGLETASDSAETAPRAPVVTFMGHVDHGKTSLLDKIRKTRVTAKEAGGITQHLGAYSVDREGDQVVFIDTPGHQAFTDMRARGANVTDVAVLVVAADDGVKPQTEEAYRHAKAADVPIVVALNKIDKDNSNPMRAKQQLSELGLLPVEWNGETEVVEVSAETGQGLDTLLETLSLTAEILDLRADANRSAIGVVLDAEASKGRGVVATVLIREGTLKVGDHVVCGTAHGRVRGMWVNGTQTIEEAGPSSPVQLTGLNLAPEAGEKLYAVGAGPKAREIAEARAERERERAHSERQHKPVTLESIFDHLEKKDEPQILNLILKSDVRGSGEALANAITNLSTDEVQVRILHSGVGAITQDDVSLADASKAIVIGFHVTSDQRARVLAEERGVEIRRYRVIYEAIDEIKAAMESRLAPEHEEQVKGHAEIREVYKASKIGSIAGCFVVDGNISRSDKVRLLRDGRVAYEGDIGSLRRFKDDVREVKEGFECGIKIAKFDDIKDGDVIEAFTLIEKRRTI